MLGIHPRAAAIAWTVFLLILSLGLIYLIRRTLIMFLVAIFFAYMLSPLVDLVNRFTFKRFSRNITLAVVYVALLGVLVTIGIAGGYRIADESRNLASRLPEIVKAQDLGAWHVPEWMEPLRASFVEWLHAFQASSSEQLLPMLRRAGEGLVSLLGNVAFVALVPILSFFFLKDGKNFRKAILEQIDERHRRMLEDILDDVHLLLGQYIRALVILAAATLVFYGLFFMILGLPYAFLLASVAGLLEFIPVIGPLAAVLIVLGVSLVTGFGHLVALLAFFGLYRLFQDYILLPHLMSSGVELPPLVVIFGALAGEQIAGIPGMFFSIPVLATLRVIYVRVMKSRGQNPLPEISPS